MTTWLVVEDEPDLYEVLIAMTQLLGVDGIAFPNGEDAIAWIEDYEAEGNNDEPPELALLDVRLPTEIGGAAVSACLRKSTKLGNMMIVLMTAYHMTKTEEKQLLKEAGADFLVYKPLPSLSAFSKLLKDNLRRRRARRSSDPLSL